MKYSAGEPPRPSTLIGISLDPSSPFAHGRASPGTRTGLRIIRRTGCPPGGAAGRVPPSRCFRSKTRPNWLPMCAMACSSGSSGSTASLEKNSSAATKFHQRGLLVQGSLRLLPGRQVPDEGAEEVGISDAGRRDRQFHGEFPAVAAQGRRFEQAPGGGRFHGSRARARRAVPAPRPSRPGADPLSPDWLRRSRPRVLSRQVPARVERGPLAAATARPWAAGSPLIHRPLSTWVPSPSPSTTRTRLVPTRPRRTSMRTRKWDTASIDVGNRGGEERAASGFQDSG
jgi:hypothetical protein